MTPRLLTILFGLTISSSSFGQQLTYRGELVDTVKIVSNISGYHFDTCGTTTGINDEYIVVFNKEKNKYILNPYQRTKYTITFRPDTSFRKQEILKQGIVVNPLVISNLLKEVEVTYVKPTFENIGITNEEFLKLTNNKHVVQVAKWHRRDSHFKKYSSTKEQKNDFFKGCQNTDTLNMYLATEYDTSGYVMITDYNDHFDIIISTTTNRYRFEGKYPNSFKQPWYNHSSKRSIPSPSVLNFSINSALVALLPNNFSRLETLKFESLINDYIEWYLKRRRIIF